MRGVLQWACEGAGGEGGGRDGNALCVIVSNRRGTHQPLNYGLCFDVDVGIMPKLFKQK